MSDLDFIFHKNREQPELNSPIFIEGLPGVGNVGKLAAEHLLHELGAEKLADIYSKHFPPQVLVSDEGVVDLVGNSLFFYKRPENTVDEDDKTTDGDKEDKKSSSDKVSEVSDDKTTDWNSSDIVFLVGDYQGLTPEGQYELAYSVLKYAQSIGTKKIITMGGYGTGKLLEEHRVLGATTSDAIAEEMKTHGVVFQPGEPGSGIVGASGLLLGLGMTMNMDGVCLMGETSGYFVDPKSARASLGVLCKILGLEVDVSALDTRAKEIDEITSKLKDMENKSLDPSDDKEFLRYIG